MDWENCDDHEKWREIYPRFRKSLDGVRSTKALLRHSFYLQNVDFLERLLSAPQMYSPRSIVRRRHSSLKLRIVNWNIERGLSYDEVLSVLQTHPGISDFDVLILTECDWGMARTLNRHVAFTLAKALNCYAAFVPAYLNLDLGNGGESTSVSGENELGFQGHAILSRIPFHRQNVAPMRNPKDYVKGKERQIGQEKALWTSVLWDGQEIWFGCVHLAAHASVRGRAMQFLDAVSPLRETPSAAVLAGDFNTNSVNGRNAALAFLDFSWKVARGIHRVVREELPRPERYRERKLFELARREGFLHEGFTPEGEPTLVYDFSDPFVRKSLGDWVPDTLFFLADRALSKLDGRVAFKVDWILGRGVYGENPEVIRDLPRHESRISDHDPVATWIQTSLS